MKSHIIDFEIQIDLEDDAVGLPKKIIIYTSDPKNNLRWVYTEPDIEELLKGKWVKRGKLKC